MQSIVTCSSAISFLIARWFKSWQHVGSPPCDADKRKRGSNEKSRTRFSCRTHSKAQSTADYPACGESRATREDSEAFAEIKRCFTRRKMQPSEKLKHVDNT